LRNTSAVLIHLAEIALSNGIPLIGSLAGPRDGLGIIPRHATAESIHETETDLGQSIPLIGSLARPRSSLGGILFDAFAYFVHQAEPVLGFCITLFSGSAGLAKFRRQHLIADLVQRGFGLGQGRCNDAKTKTQRQRLSQ